MNILVACEESQRVCLAFRNKGHNAFSCDILDCSGGAPEYHIKGDVLPLLNGYCTFKTQDSLTHYLNSRWDMLIAFPPCTHLAVSGARHFDKKRKDGRQIDAVQFFMKFINADCDKIAIENPVGIISGDYLMTHFNIQPIKPTQIIQPYFFGDHVKKTTCLWLKNLPMLKPTNIVEPDLITYVYKSGKKVTFDKYMVKGFKSTDRARHRSKTFQGIANAMAEQWG